MKKKAVALLSALALMVCLCAPAMAAFDVDAARRGVAAIYVCFELVDGQEAGICSGSCFFVGTPGEPPTYAVTNNHVIADWKKYGEGKLGTISDTTLTGRAKIRVHFDAVNYVEAYHVASDETKDVAILRLDRPTTERSALKLRTPTEEMIATPVHAIGYPGLADNEIVSPTTKWGLYDSSIDSGHISRLATSSGTGRAVVQLDFSFRHGNSGGPLVNDAGEVLGITTMGVIDYAEGESVDYAVNIREAASMLDREGITYVIDDDPLPFPLLPVIIGVAAAVIVVLVLVVVLKKVINKRPTPKPMNKRPALISLSSQHNGMMLTLENRQIVAGRQGCDLVFRDGTPGVSGKHCSITWDAGAKDFVVTDLQSSFGTYLQNGQRLAPNTGTHLKAGDAFYLGDPANTLRVDFV